RSPPQRRRRRRSVRSRPGSGLSPSGSPPLSGACQAPDESAHVGRMLELGDGADDGGRLPGVENRRRVPPELLLGFLPREGIGRRAFVRTGPQRVAPPGALDYDLRGPEARSVVGGLLQRSQLDPTSQLAHERVRAAVLVADAPV